MNNLDLPHDLWTDILALLSVKKLAIFRSVCKSWRNCIDSPFFISKHRVLYNKEHSKNSHLHRVTIGQNQELTNLVSFFSFTEHRGFTPCYHGCSNGLYLISINFDEGHLWLWNPFLRRCLILPPCPISNPFQSVNYIIGFSESCDDYKVLAYRLHTVINGDEYEPAMAVYSLRNHTWTIKINHMNVDAWISLSNRFSQYNYVYCGSIVYWYIEGDFAIIRSFDFRTEEFNNLAAPEPLKECEILVLFAIGDLLAVISSSCIWVLEKHDGEYAWKEWCSESWIKAVFDIFKEHYRSTIKVLFLEETKTFLIIGYAGSVHFYQVTSRLFGTLRNRGGYFLAVSDYVESLVLLTGTEGMTFQTFPENWPLSIQCK